MTTAGPFDAPIEIFGGLVTDVSPADLPHGVSPDCQDVVFSDGGVKTRPGLQALFGPLAGNPTINYVKTYITLNQTLRTLVLDANGNLHKETTPGALASVTSGLAANSYANSTTLFGREYLGISDKKVGNDLPRQFDDTNPHARSSRRFAQRPRQRLAQSRRIFLLAGLLTGRHPRRSAGRVFLIALPPNSTEGTLSHRSI